MNLVVILGHRLNDDGTMDNELIERLELGIKTFNEVKPDYLCLCGGVANLKAMVSEASLMFEYAINHNVDENKIICEDKSKITFTNALNLRFILKGEKIDNIYLVSSEYHFKRKYLPNCFNLFKFVFPKTNIIKVY